MLAGCAYDAPASTADAPAAIDAPGDIDGIPFTCPTGYVVLSGAPGGSKYKKFGADGDQTPSPSPGRANWVAAEAACRAEGPGIHLAIAEDEAGHQALSDIVSGASRWLGVTDRKTDGTWLPIIGGTAHVEHWLGGTPGTQPGYDCYLLTRVVQGTINMAEATTCSGQGSPPPEQWDKGYICECDGKAVDPATF